MNCDRAHPLIDAYTTDELDLAAALDVEQHLKECPACTRELESLHALRSTLASPSLRYAAPPDLRRRVSVNPSSSDARQNPPPAFRINRFALAAAIGLLLLLPWLTFYWNASRSSASRLADEITASHIRSLMTDHLLDVPSTDQHTVKPWFNGKLDFSPTVIDLTAEGFPLIGGRLDFIDNRPVAAIVYQRHKHLINLFTWPTRSGDSAPTLSQHNGYNLLIWNQSGMTRCAVSDLNPLELGQFAELLRPSAASSTSR